MDNPVLTPDMILNAYAGGLFPMAEHDGLDSPIHFYRPNPRTLFTVDTFHMPKRVLRWMRQTHLTVRYPDDVQTIMQQCGAQRNETWINPVLLDLYTTLAKHHFVQAIGVYDGDQLVGGLYWVQMGLAVMAESMFSRVTNASKLALITVMTGLYARSKRLDLTTDQQWMDVQYINPHLEQFHPVQITSKKYQSLLYSALDFSGAASDDAVGFSASDFSATSLADFLQFKTQIS